MGMFDQFNNARVWCPAAGGFRPQNPNCLIEPDSDEDLFPLVAEEARRHMEEIEMRWAFQAGDDPANPVLVLVEYDDQEIRVDVHARVVRQLVTVVRGDLIS